MAGFFVNPGGPAPEFAVTANDADVAKFVTTQDAGGIRLADRNTSNPGFGNTLLTSNGTLHVTRGRGPNLPPVRVATFGTCVGINRDAPKFTLDVSGDVNVGRNLHLGGSLILLPTATTRDGVAGARFTSNLFLDSDPGTGAPSSLRATGGGAFGGGVTAATLAARGAVSGCNVNASYDLGYSDSARAFASALGGETPLLCAAPAAFDTDRTLYSAAYRAATSNVVVALAGVVAPPGGPPPPQRELRVWPSEGAASVAVAPSSGHVAVAGRALFPTTLVNGVPTTHGLLRWTGVDGVAGAAAAPWAQSSGYLLYSLRGSNALWNAHVELAAPSAVACSSDGGRVAIAGVASGGGQTYDASGVAAALTAGPGLFLDVFDALGRRTHAARYDGAFRNPALAFDPADDMPVLGAGFTGALTCGSAAFDTLVSSSSNAFYTATTTTAAPLTGSNLHIYATDTFTACNVDLGTLTYRTAVQRPAPVSTWYIGNDAVRDLGGIDYWHTAPTADSQWESACWAPELGRFVAVGSNAAMSSPNATGWTRVADGNTGRSWKEVCWSSTHARLCAVGPTGVMLSSNADAWWQPTYAPPTYNDGSSISFEWASVCRTSNAFIAVSRTNSGTMTSSNGDAWFFPSYDVVANARMNSVAYAPELNRVCAVGAGAKHSANEGATWTAASLPAGTSTPELNAVCWSPGRSAFVAVGSNAALTSANGSAWTVAASPGNKSWTSVAWSPEWALFVACSDAGDVASSPDCAAWTPRFAEPGTVFASACWSPASNMFAAVAKSGAVAVTNQAFRPYAVAERIEVVQRALTVPATPFTSNAMVAKFDTGKGALRWLSVFGSVASNAEVDALCADVACIATFGAACNVGTFDMSVARRLGASGEVFARGAPVPAGSAGFVARIDGATGALVWTAPADHRARAACVSPVGASVITTAPPNLVEWRRHADGATARAPLAPLAEPVPAGARVASAAVEPASGSVYLAGTCAAAGTALEFSSAGLAGIDGSGAFVAKYAPYVDAPGANQLTENTGAGIAALAVFQRGAGPALRLDAAREAGGGALLEGRCANAVVFAVSAEGDVTVRNERGAATDFDAARFGAAAVDGDLAAGATTTSNLRVTVDARVDGALAAATLRATRDFDLAGLLRGAFDGALRSTAAETHIAGITYASNDARFGGPAASTAVITDGRVLVSNDLTVTSNIFTSNLAVADARADRASASNARVGQTLAVGGATDAVFLTSNFVGVGFLQPTDGKSYATTTKARLHVDGETRSKSFISDELIVGGNVVQANGVQLAVGCTPAATLALAESAMHNAKMVVRGNAWFQGNLYVDGTTVYQNLSTGNQSFTITDTGVGIFNATPTATLDVSGTGYFSARVVVGYGNVATNTDPGYAALHGADAVAVNGSARIQSSTAGSNALRVTQNSAGSGSGGAYVEIPADSLAPIAEFATWSAGGATTPYLVVGRDGDTVVSTAGGEVMRVTKSRNVLVGFAGAVDAAGRALPQGGLDVSGGVRLRHRTAAGAVFEGDLSGNLRGPYVRCGSNPDAESANFEARALQCVNTPNGAGGYVHALLVNPFKDYDAGVTFKSDVAFGGCNASNLGTCTSTAFKSDAYRTQAGLAMLSQPAASASSFLLGEADTAWPLGVTVCPPARFSKGVIVGPSSILPNNTLKAGHLWATDRMAVGSSIVTTGSATEVSLSADYTLDVAGVIRAADVYTTSDARIKREVRGIDDALDTIDRMRGVTFVKGDDASRTMGLIAQELRDVVPEAVTEDSRSFLSVNYGSLVALLVEGIKAQREEMRALKTRLGIP